MAKVSNFIPKKGVNKAIKEIREKASSNMAKGIESRASSEFQSKLAAAHNKMKSGINYGSNNSVVDIIESNTGIKKPRKPNGKTDKKSIRESVHTFNLNREKILENEKIADIKLKQIAAEKTGDNAKVANAIGQMRDNRLANEIAEEYGRGNGNKANRRIEEMRAKKTHEGERRSLQRQIDAAADAEDLDKVLSLQDKLDKLGEYQEKGPKKTFQERKAERIERNQNAKIAKEMGGSFGDIDHTRSANKKIAQPETSPGNSGNASALKHLSDKMKGNNTVYNMAALGVGGGLVLNMANNKGQQSNAQLYGQY